MNSPRITYTIRPHATSEGESNALAACYRFILFESSASKQEAAESTQSDGREDHKKLADEQRRLHDLTNEIATNSLEAEGVRQEKKGTEKMALFIAED